MLGHVISRTCPGHFVSSICIMCTSAIHSFRHDMLYRHIYVSSSLSHMPPITKHCHVNRGTSRDSKLHRQKRWSSCRGESTAAAWVLALEMHWDPQRLMLWSGCIRYGRGLRHDCSRQHEQLCLEWTIATNMLSRAFKGQDHLLPYARSQCSLNT